MRLSRFLYSILAFVLLLSFLKIPLPCTGQTSDFINIINENINITFGTLKSQQGWYFGDTDYLFQGSEYFAVGNCSQAVASSFPFYYTVLERFPAASGVPDTWYGCRLRMNALGFQLEIRRSIYVPSNSSYFFINYNITNFGTAEIPVGKFFQVINYRCPVMMPIDEAGYIQTQDAMVNNSTMPAWKGFKCVTANSSDHGVYMLQSDGSLIGEDIAQCRLNNEGLWRKANATHFYPYLALATDSGMNLNPGGSLSICFNVAFGGSEAGLYQLLSNKPDFMKKHAMSILNMSKLKTMVMQGYPVPVTVEVANTGDYTETFNVALYANQVLVATKLVKDLQPSGTRQVKFFWKTTGFKAGSYVMTSRITRIFEGETVVYDEQSDEQAAIIGGYGYWIIVAGNLQGSSLGEIVYECNQVYNILLEVGYRKHQIYYLSQPEEWVDKDPDLDGLSDVNANATSQNLQYAIEDWAASRVSSNEPLFIFLDNHGGVDEFLIDEPDRVNSTSLNEWLDTVESATGASCHLVYTGCHSGSFIDELSKAGRLVITSCNASESSWTIGVDPEESPWYSPYFSPEWFTMYFWPEIQSGSCVLDAFNTACEYVLLVATEYGRVQTPLLDDDGNGIGNTAVLPFGGDGSLAANLHIGLCEWPDPWISYAIASQTFVWPPTQDVILWARVDNQTNLSHVNAWMQDPNWLPPPVNETRIIPDIERYEMTDPDNDGNWTVTIPAVNFTNHASEPSLFNFLITAVESSGYISSPAVTHVEFTLAGLPSGDTNDPIVNIRRPLDQQIARGEVSVNGTVSDACCVKQLKLYIDDILLNATFLPPASTAFFSFDLDTTQLTNDTHTITVKATDESNNNASATIRIYVENYVHDLLVTDITPSATTIERGTQTNITVTTANHGSYTEDFNLTLYADSMPIESKPLTLTAGNFTITEFSWDGTGFSNGNYTLQACISQVENEADTTNNNLTLTWQPVTIIAEFPSEVFMPLFATVTLIAAIAYRRKRRDSLARAGECTN